MSKAVYGLYTYSESPAKGIVGLAQFDGSKLARTGTLITEGLTGDTKVFSYKNPKGESRIMVAQCVWNDDQTADPMLLTSYDENLKQVGNLNRTSVSGRDQNGKKVTLLNAYGMAPVTGYNSNGGVWGRMLCIVDYDGCAVFGIPAYEDNAQSTACHVYSFTPLEGRKGLGQDIAIEGKNVYALFVDGKNPNGGDYSGYMLVRLGDELSNPVEHYVPTKNPFSLNLYGDNLYITSVGGMQNYGFTNGENSKIERITKEFTAYSLEDSKNGVKDNELVTVFKGGTQPYEGDFRAFTYSANGDAFILTGRFDADGLGLSGVLYHTSMKILESEKETKITEVETFEDPVKFNSVKGYWWTLLYSDTDQSLWISTGNDLSVYKVEEDNLVKKATLDVKTMAGGRENYSMNRFALVGEAKSFKGAVPYAFASISKEALLEREKLLKK